MSNSIGHNLIHHNLLTLVVLEHQSKINSSCISGYNLFQVQANSQIRKSHITSKFWGKCLNLRKTKLPMGTNRVFSVFPQSVLATDPTSKNNRLSNISGNASLPANVTVRLQGNPICLNTNLVLFCGPQNENETVSHTLSATNSNDNCLVQSCPYEYAPNSPCFCVAPLIVGYRLKSPGFRYFESYWVPFEMYLTKVIPSSTSKSGISKGALAGIVVGTILES
ncbi:putative LRR receptor-like serine/threonine-protein kinase [Camellia lanceoleosa]|uniref:LRR receptor-like serine/threonine-protein kinase n=1 Tax=Camellia lanceoleosa TaxID=1840588 RepID=A0ACC0IS69_9ERIC|nr:putative LRR receptor-like serine/threonine-protein kinase [Camellia lanceoleosa]